VPDYANVLVKVVVILDVINPVPATTPAHNVFCFTVVAHILTHSANWAFRPKSGFKNKCRARAGAGFRLQNEAFSQLCVGSGSNMGRLKGYNLHPPTAKINFTLILGQMFLLLVREYQWRFW